MCCILPWHRYCPQFDAIIDMLTGRETLELFCRLRGVAEDDIPPMVVGLFKVLNFRDHINKIVDSYVQTKQNKAPRPYPSECDGALSRCGMLGSARICATAQGLGGSAVLYSQTRQRG